MQDSELGWAITGSAKFGLPMTGEKDNFKITMHYGGGYGTQIKGGPKERILDPTSAHLETIDMMGGGDIQHFYSSKFRSNLVYGSLLMSTTQALSATTPSKALNILPSI